MTEKDLEKTARNIQSLLKGTSNNSFNDTESETERNILIQRRNSLVSILGIDNTIDNYIQILSYWKGKGPNVFEEYLPALDQAISFYPQNISRAIRLLSRLFAWSVIEQLSVHGSSEASSDISTLVALEFGLNPELPSTEIFSVVATHTKLLPDLILRRHERSIRQDLDKVTQKRDEITAALKSWGDVIKAENTKVDQTKSQIDQYIGVLEKYKTELAFLGLSSAFKNFFNRKRSANQKQLFLLWALALITLAAPFVSHHLIESFFPEISKGADFVKTVLLYIPFAAFEIFAIYFFRVVLVHYNSTQAQLLQLEMKMAACGFIQDYTIFSKENKDADLSKFEALVFGGIVADMGKVPSTFDGVEVLTGLMKEMRGKP